LRLCSRREAHGLLRTPRITEVHSQCALISQPTTEGRTTVNLYEHIACFFAGVFLANAVPHFVHGISGDRFPTPFAHPPGRGLSSPTVNVVWALFNLVVEYILFRVGKVSSGEDTALVIFFAGLVIISTMLSMRFAKKQANQRLRSPNSTRTRWVKIRMLISGTLYSTLRIVSGQSVRRFGFNTLGSLMPVSA
jgi:hypothetical protein